MNTWQDDRGRRWIHKDHACIYVIHLELPCLLFKVTEDIYYMTFLIMKFLIISGSIIAHKNRTCTCFIPYRLP